MKFSQVAEAYNMNSRNLDEARTSFEEEARNFIQTVSIFINSEIKKLNQNKILADRRHWHNAETTSSKAAMPLGFYAESKLLLAIRPPGAKNFKNRSGIISFQISFEEEMNQFAFKGVFTNTDEVNEYIDEKLAEICRVNLASLPAAFNKNEVHKTKEYVAFKCPLSNELWDEFGKLITALFEQCEKTIDSLYEAEKASQKTA
jgi:hypothetical protein